jgi:riboflavin-specific deaminase-like protein
MKQLLPLPACDVDVETVYRDLTFPEPPAERPYVILNFVQTIDGQTTLGSGGAAGLGSAVDQRLMKRLRVVADMLLHGAGTVRQDNFPPGVPKDLEHERLARGLRAQPTGVVVTASGRLLPENRYFSRPGALILTTRQQEERLHQLFDARATVISVGDQAVDLRAALGMLRQRFGARVVLCEGGPRLAYNLVENRLVDELFLTIAPKLGSDPRALRLLDGPAFDPAALPQAQLLHVLVADSELFVRYRLAPSST